MSSKKPAAKTTPAKPAAKAPAATAKTGAKPGAKPAAKTGAKPAAQTGAKEPAKAAPEKKSEIAPAPVWTEVGVKQIDTEVIWDKDGKIKESGKCCLIVDERNIVARFLRHRDINMLSVLDEHEMSPDCIRRALLGSLRWGKPFAIDMMESEMFDYLKEKFDDVQKGLLDTVLSMAIVEEDKFMSLVKPEDGDDYSNQNNYVVDRFYFFVLSAFAKPNEALVNRMYLVKVV